MNEQVKLHLAERIWLRAFGTPPKLPSATSFMLGTLYDIPPASKGIIFEGFSWQRENFLNMRMYISIMIHKEVGTCQIKE